jgi:hypothetical protein
MSAGFGKIQKQEAATENLEYLLNEKCRLTGFRMPQYMALQISAMISTIPAAILRALTFII